MEKTKITGTILPVYDYVIVGGGTAGCVLANRLSEDPSRTVLLLEAGYDDAEFPDIHVPAKWSSLQRTAYDWQYKSVPQKYSCKGLRNQQMALPRGKVLGGTGSLNAMVYCRGTPRDFDLWEKMGCEGWGFEDVLPYFIKSEDCKSPDVVKCGDHGVFGPMAVTESRFSESPDVFVQAGLELGYQKSDINGRNPIGVMNAQVNTDDGLRAHTASAFLRPATKRQNLHVTTHCHVRKILVDNDIARAVEYSRLHRTEHVRAKREIILSAGVFGSAQILILSGIGPRRHLQDLGIPVVADLPVGSYLQDHAMTLGLQLELDRPILPGTIPFSRENQQRYDTMRSGPIGANGLEGIGFFRSKLRPDDDNAVIQLYFYPGLPGSEWKLHSRISDDVFEEIFLNAHDEVKAGCSFYAMVCHPKSKGTVRLRSTDPEVPPLIDPNYLADPEDLKILVEGIKLCHEFSMTEAFKSIGVKPVDRKLPGYQGDPYTDAYWEEYARTLPQFVSHLCGTCRMGRADDPTTVTDSQLRVKGIGRLRVVDASVMPEVTSSNINAPIVMIAEKAADMIKTVV